MPKNAKKQQLQKNKTNIRLQCKFFENFIDFFKKFLKKNLN